MDQAKAMSLRQTMNDNARKQLSLGRMAHEATTPEQQKALKKEQAGLAREMANIKESLVNIENA